MDGHGYNYVVILVFHSGNRSVTQCFVECVYYGGVNEVVPLCPSQKIPTLQSSARCRTASLWTTVRTEPPAFGVLQCLPLPWEVDCIGFAFFNVPRDLSLFIYFSILKSPLILRHGPLCSGAVLNEPTPGHSSSTNTRQHHCILQHFHRLPVSGQSSAPSSSSHQQPAPAADGELS
jgi:hypothetical protein